MEIRMGVWIDGGEAIIVALGEDRLVRRIAARRAQANPAAFFDEVAAALHGAGLIFLFGPGGAKEAFKDRLERDGLGLRLDGVETAGKMTVPQISAKVLAHFRPLV